MNSFSGPSAQSVLAKELLGDIRARAAGYDERNEFFHEDLDVLREIGYLVPRSLTQMITDQRSLAAHAPATALGIGMHLTWMGVARDMVAGGHSEFQWILDEGRQGELFAFGVSEKGNDRVLSDSVTTVTEVPEGFSFHGTKITVSLSPAWTRMSLLGRLGDEILHGFITRGQEGWSHSADWNTLGMRATQSYTTALSGVVIDRSRLVRRIPVGPNRDPFTVAVFQNFLLLVSSVYAGIADRALELAVVSAQEKVSAFEGNEIYAENPDVRWRASDAAIALDALGPQLATYSRWVDEGVDGGEKWFRLLSGLKHQSVETGRRVVDQALRITGGSGYSAGHELSRLARDVLAGIYHPSDTEAVHHTVATNLFSPRS